MKPIIYPRTSISIIFRKSTFTLSNFVSMMNRNMINSPSMNIKMLTKILHTHSRTFNMPTRISTSPRTIPSQSLIFKFRFSKPQNKVIRIFLIFINYNNITLPCPSLQFIKLKISKFSVISKSCNIKIQIATSHISMTISFNFLNQINHFLNMLSSATHNIWFFNIQTLNIIKKRLSIKISNLQNRLFTFLSLFYHFIFTIISVATQMTNISNIHYMLFFITQKTKSSIKNIQKYISSQISNMSIIINSRTTSIKTTKTILQRLKFLHFTTHSIIKFQTHNLPHKKTLFLYYTFFFPL